MARAAKHGGGTRARILRHISRAPSLRSSPIFPIEKSSSTNVASAYTPTTTFLPTLPHTKAPNRSGGTRQSTTRVVQKNAQSATPPKSLGILFPSRAISALPRFQRRQARSPIENPPPPPPPLVGVIFLQAPHPRRENGPGTKSSPSREAGNTALRTIRPALDATTSPNNEPPARDALCALNARVR